MIKHFNPYPIWISFGGILFRTSFSYFLINYFEAYSKESKLIGYSFFAYPFFYLLKEIFNNSFPQSKIGDNCFEIFAHSFDFIAMFSAAFILRKYRFEDSHEFSDSLDKVIHSLEIKAELSSDSAKNSLIIMIIIIVIGGMSSIGTLVLNLTIKYNLIKNQLVSCQVDNVC